MLNVLELRRFRRRFLVPGSHTRWRSVRPDESPERHVSGITDALSCLYLVFIYAVYD